MISSFMSIRYLVECKIKTNMRDSCDASSFKIIDSAKTFSQLKIKESFHIERLNPELNKQVEHVNLSLHF